MMREPFFYHPKLGPTRSRGPKLIVTGEQEKRVEYGVLDTFCSKFKFFASFKKIVKKNKPSTVPHGADLKCAGKS